MDGGVGRLASYAVDARFSRLGIAPVGAWPGFGPVGRIEGNEKGGRFSLSGRDASLDLPQLFPSRAWPWPSWPPTAAGATRTGCSR